MELGIKGDATMLINKSEKAIQQGCKVFDCTLPQRWLTDMAQRLADHQYPDEETGFDMCYHQLLTATVWCYDDEPIFGKPVYLSPLLERMVNQMESEL